MGGDYFGIDHDDYTEVPANVSTVVDLLEDKQISWGSYQEDMPYTGFTGDTFHNAALKRDMYVRKHNPLVMFNSVGKNETRLGCIKNTTMFYEDLQKKKLPQWMFITPNMTSNGHDTSITYAGVWMKKFLSPLLENDYFTKVGLVYDAVSDNGPRLMERCRIH